MNAAFLWFILFFPHSCFTNKNQCLIFHWMTALQFSKLIKSLTSSVHWLFPLFYYKRKCQILRPLIQNFQKHLSSLGEISCLWNNRLTWSPPCTTPDLISNFIIAANKILPGWLPAQPNFKQWGQIPLSGTETAGEHVIRYRDFRLDFNLDTKPQTPALAKPEHGALNSHSAI